MEKLKLSERTIAVLSFINISGSKDIEYFSDRITGEITNAMASINQLKVISGTSSFYLHHLHIKI